MDDTVRGPLLRGPLPYRGRGGRVTGAEDEGTYGERT